MISELVALGLIWYVAFLLSLTCHEAAHALVAKLAGDPTAYEAGQVTLNPLPHMRREPVGTILAPLITFVASKFMIGWASAPYDPFWQQRHPKRAAWMALAGPVANVILLLLAGVAIRVGVEVGWFTIPDRVTFSHMAGGVTATGEGVAKFLSILFSLNLLLGTFNLVPLPPLDGATAIGVFMSERMALKFAELAHNPMFSFVGLVIAWQVFGQISGAVFGFGVDLLYPGLFK